MKIVLNRKAILFPRDEEGKLIPLEVKLEINEENEEQLEYKDETVKITPMVRGEIAKMFESLKDTDEDESSIDADIIEKHCISPCVKKEEVKFMKPSYISMIVNTILRESGLSTNKSKKKAITEKEDDFAKN